MQATWDLPDIDGNHVALIVATFSLLATISVLVYFVFQLAVQASMAPVLGDIPSGLRAAFPS